MYLSNVGNSPDAEGCWLAEVMDQNRHQSHDVERQATVLGGVKHWLGGERGDIRQQAACGLCHTL